MDNLREYVKFLDKFSWVYNVHMTRLLLDGTLERIPLEWIHHISALSTQELGEVPYGLIKEDWPTTLREFVRQAVELGEVRFRPPGPCVPMGLPGLLSRGMTPQKQREVPGLAALVADVCRQARCTSVLDVGSGLGYLAQVLHHSYGFRVIGLDCEPSHLEKANNRLKLSGCSKNIHYHTLKIDDSMQSVASVGSLLKSCPPHVECSCGPQETMHRKFNEGQFVMVALHACGRLTPTMVYHFCHLEQICAVVCIGCCYHKGAPWFPLSTALGQLLSQGQLGGVPGRLQGLRLACQGTRQSWRDRSGPQRQAQSRHVLYRALLERTLQKDGLPWRKSKRHMARDSHTVSFEAYVDHIMQDVSCESEEQRTGWRNLLEGLQSEAKKLLPAVGTHALLQQLLQPVWEELVVRDRMAWAGELGLSCRVSPAFVGSPRDLALVVLGPRPPPGPCRPPAPHPGDLGCAPCTPPAASPAADGPAVPHRDGPHRVDAGAGLPLLACESEVFGSTDRSLDKTCR
ncbi:protein RRNAD1 isoform X1 [Ixodes scapularis]|uniref:protein RRNAD1 isoform X1 n=1 Tax=Ixodes scapularis TaxID=6945 RepID=UPI001A9F24C9|nr:protein RRNAD1 isoform X1 [Ixodes scapularis]